jgi:hypothetical protein
MDEPFDGDHVACNDTGILQQLLRLLVEAAAARNDGVRNSEKDNLDKLDTNNLSRLVPAPADECRQLTSFSFAL